MKYYYDVVLSFAGEDREYVEEWENSCMQCSNCRKESEYSDPA